MTKRPKLPLPNGLIGQAEPVRFDMAAARPFFPFLSIQQVFLLLAIYVVVIGAIILIAPRVWIFVAVGGAMGMLPSIIEAAPARVTLRTPRPEPWADFTRQWAASSRYLPDPGDNDVWFPNMPFWIKWPGDSLRLRVAQNELEVRGRRLLIRQLKRNFDRMTQLGHPWPEGPVSS